MTGVANNVVRPARQDRNIGRYVLHLRIATGGMASVYLGSLVAPIGFSRTVAIKQLHAQFAHDPDYVKMFLDEAHLVSRIRHPNVVPTIDVILSEDEVYLVMEYIEGATVSHLRCLAHAGRIPVPIAVAVLSNALEGLHAAHEATDAEGRSLGIIHRDVSPQNVLVGVDGVARVLDFGVAKANGRFASTQVGVAKGKLGYMAPEQIRDGDIDRRADLYSTSVLLWEVLTGERLFGKADNVAQLLYRAMEHSIRTPRSIVPNIPESIETVIMKGLAKDPAERFLTAREMALALRKAGSVATALEVSDWVRATARDWLSTRAAAVAEVERQANARIVSDARRFTDSLDGASDVVVDEDDKEPAGSRPLRRNGSAGGDGVPNTAGPVGQHRGRFVVLAAVSLLSVATVITFAVHRGNQKARPVPEPTAVTDDDAVPVGVLDTNGRPSPSPSAVPETAPPATGKSAPVSRRRLIRPSTTQPARSRIDGLFERN